MDRGANINAKNSYGWTSLMFASSAGYLPIVKVLLDRSASIGIKNTVGKTALILASMTGHLKNC